MSEQTMNIGWCTPCGAWRERTYAGRSPMCSECRSGAIRPPLPGEEPAIALMAPPRTLTQDEIDRLEAG